MINLFMSMVAVECPQQTPVMIDQENAVLKSLQESHRLVASNATSVSSVTLCEVGNTDYTLSVGSC